MPCGDCVALRIHMHTWSYRASNGGEHTVRTDGVCLTCSRPHPAYGTPQERRDWVRGTLWRHDPVYAAQLTAICAGITVAERNRKVTAMVLSPDHSWDG